MYPTNNPNPVYVFALAMSQLGSSTYSGASIAYNGSVAEPSNMCINANSLRATATLGSNNNFSMTITDTSTNTIISVQGTLSSQSNALSGSYTNGASQACTAIAGHDDHGSAVGEATLALSLTAFCGSGLPALIYNRANGVEESHNHAKDRTRHAAARLCNLA